MVAKVVRRHPLFAAAEDCLGEHIERDEKELASASLSGDLGCLLFCDGVKAGSGDAGVVHWVDPCAGAEDFLRLRPADELPLGLRSCDRDDDRPARRRDLDVLFASRLFDDP